MVVIKDAGHAVNLEKPKEVCKNVIEFFKEPAAEVANGRGAPFYRGGADGSGGRR